MDNLIVDIPPDPSPAAASPERSTEGQGEAFRAAMRRLSGSVSVVTTGRGAERTGFTATSVCSLSVEPPRLLVCLDRHSSSWPALHHFGAFCVNVLTEDQQPIADRFAGRDGMTGGGRYDHAQWHEMASGAAVLTGALAAVDCELEEAIERHSHAILIGRVRAVALQGEARPLLYWHGGYRRLLP